MDKENKPHLTFWQIWNMSFGFLGVQYAFGLQQANMSPIYRYLGADESQIPLLWLAGPITGLLIQPFIGAMSDNTWHRRWGRRRPYFIIGALITSFALMLMPYSKELWMAASLLWILDGGANIIMQPFRALIADKLPNEQRSLGYSMQSFFAGFGQTLANVMPFVLTAIGVATIATSQPHSIPDFVRISFFIGAVAILFSVGVTVFTTRETPPEHLLMEQRPKKSFASHISEIISSLKEMPAEMKQLWWVKFFTWFSLPLMWQYLSLSIAKNCFNAPAPGYAGFEEGIKYGNLGLAIFNILCFLVAIILPKLSKRYPLKKIHALALLIGAIGFISMKFTNDVTHFMIGMALVGVAWASIMSIPYVMLSNALPVNRMGVYMGIFNAFIVIPQIVNMLVTPLIYNTILRGDPINALVLSGIGLVCAAIASLRLRF